MSNITSNAALTDAQSQNDISRNVRQYRDLDLFFSRKNGTNDIEKITDVEAVKRSVRNLVLTNFYEKPFHPEIGSGIRDMLFENMTPITAVVLARKVEDVIEKEIGNYEKGKIYNDPGATLTDPSFVLNTDTSNINTSIAGNYYVIYSANDTLGNISYTIRNVLVKDVNFPNITPIGDNPTIVNIDTSYNELGATLENSLSFNTVFNNVNVFSIIFKLY